MAGALSLVAVPGASALTTSQKIRRDLDHVFKANRKHVVGMCVGAKAGDVGVIRCYGRRAAGSSAPAKASTLWAIDSLTKTFAATLLALRVHQGSLSLTNTVQTFMPTADQAGVGSAMTLQQLANHHSGLPRLQPSPPPQDVGDVFDQLAACEPDSNCRLDQPGAAYHYSNFAFNVLGQILAQHDGFRASAGIRGWDADNRKNVTGPLDLKQTLTYDTWKNCCNSTFLARRARGTNASGQPTADPPTFPGAPVTNPAGGLFSTARDMFRWMRFSMGELGPPGLRAAQKLLYAKHLQPTNNAKPNAGKVGLGWQINIHGKVRCVYKAGGGLGFSSYMTFVQGRPRGAFVLLNTDHGIDATTPKAADLANAIIDGLPFTGKKPVCSTSTPPADAGPAG